MARINWKGWVAVEGLSNDAAKAAIKEIGAARLELGKVGDAKAQREIKSIADKWAKKYPCQPDCAPGAPAKSETVPKAAAPKSKAAPKAKAPKSKAASAPKSKAAPSKAAPKAKSAPKGDAAPKAEAPKSKTTSKAEGAPKSKTTSKAEGAPESKTAPKVRASKKAAPKSKPKPTTTAKATPAPKSEPKAKPAAPKSGKPEAAAKSKPAPKVAKPKKPKAAKAKEPNVTADKIKELRTKLVNELGKLRVMCPGEKKKLVDDAAAALATARAVALVSPAVRKARDELQAALKGFAGYEAAKEAIAAAEKSVPVQQAKEHVKAVLAEQLTENEQQIIEDAEKDPRVIAAREKLKAARSPEAVQKAQEDLNAARDICRRSARTLRETYGDTIVKLRADMAKEPPVVSDMPIVVPTAEELLFGTGPRTVASARAVS